MYDKVLCWMAKSVLPLGFSYVFNLYFAFNLPVGLDYFWVVTVLGVCSTVKILLKSLFPCSCARPVTVIVSVSMLLCIGPRLPPGSC